MRYQSSCLEQCRRVLGPVGVMAMELRIRKGQDHGVSTAISMTVKSTFFKTNIKEKPSHLLTYESGPSKTLIDYCIVRRNERKFLKDIKALPSEEFITQYKPLACDFMIRNIKDTSRNNAPRRKIWKLHEDSVKRDFSSCINKYRQSSQEDASVEGY